MSDWYKMSEDELSQDSGILERQQSYYNTFYRTDEGRCVLLDIQRMCFEQANTPEASLALINLYLRIRALCGVNIDMEKASLDAEAKLINLQEAD